jgi:hypothetical protein
VRFAISHSQGLYGVQSKIIDLKSLMQIRVLKTDGPSCLSVDLPSILALQRPQSVVYCLTVEQGSVKIVL